MKRIIIAALVAACSLTGATAASAATVIEDDVTRLNENAPFPAGTDWVVYTRNNATVTTPAGAAQFVEGPAPAPLGTGSLQLTTANGSQKVQAFTDQFAGRPLASAGTIAYQAQRVAGPLTGDADLVAALNMTIDFNGLEAPGGFSTLVYEPTYNAPAGAVTTGAWQTWTASSGVWWSTAALNGQCSGAAVACHRSFSQIVANNPDAVIGLVGFNQGSGNNGLTTAVDALQFGGTTTDFEADDDADDDGVRDGSDNCVDDPNPGQEDHDGDGIGSACDAEELPTTADDCKKQGFTKWTPSFKNQGDCVSFVSSQKA